MSWCLQTDVAGANKDAVSLIEHVYCRRIVLERRLDVPIPEVVTPFRWHVRRAWPGSVERPQ